MPCGCTFSCSERFAEPVQPPENTPVHLTARQGHESTNFGHQADQGATTGD